ncbi:MAG: radical SAM protein [Thermoanaerobaculia bacterium]
MSDASAGRPPFRGELQPGAPIVSEAPIVELRSLDTVWFQVAGTVCNLACSHCFVSSSPTNHTHENLSFEEVEERLVEAAGLGTKEYYFTGGEPFLNPEIERILARTLDFGPATVLTNGLLLAPDRCRRLAKIAADSPYSLDFRVSMDGYSAETNDPIRGEGTFERILEGISNLIAAGLNPVITVTEVHDENRSERGKLRFFELLRDLGIEKPRLKILPLFQIGAEAARTGAYESWQRLRASDNPGSWNHLQCSSCRMATDQGVWVCPILVNEPGGKMGETLADTLTGFAMTHSACWTCHVYGVSCRT